MEFRHLRYFLVLAEELHFGRAARRLAISQPPLSLNIQQLEASVGARLFDRDSRGVRLTAAGRAFRESATALLAQAEAARVLAREIEAGAVGRLRVGFVGSMLYRGLPQTLREFQAAYPGIHVALTELNSQEQIDALLHDELDAAFIHTGRVPDTLQATLVHSEPFVCCLPADHPLAALAELPLTSLRGEPFVLFSRKASPDYYSRIFDMCAAQGFFPQIRHEVRHWLSVVSLVSQGMGVAVVPAALERSGMAGAAFRPLADAAVRSEVYCAWKTAPDHPARDHFVAMVAGKPAQRKRSHQEKATGPGTDGL
ncbi:LysR substrate-binding domain-containing protein [Cupriavidus taiwanensis]|uniref:Transcriptional regulator, LysR family n=2 Tax=Cupriavidus taiwanensis TaxID=164546 RepID=B2AHN1_CUPTR|nr:LysR substrate-binding domain-containing protein [Cupriavidus taiwanensis]CAP63280.1 putative transcriptional regulator, LysR family [Cupriavidus taiwanensis LMG 19424]SOZ09343.1 putative transcriptional regulator, LysR family [Cupriavidus taiwanensis]SOZ11469.1 putative transcriptional regulator, LysR family [Cupriavidus taiwanensis]SOZ42823.1 putative transcriptional regulator, LysR family [Cupriavidus taiwanensis]SPC19574.1 putative transcriptional regulator, LysR family [Cupriavidus tai